MRAIDFVVDFKYWQLAVNSVRNYQLEELSGYICCLLKEIDLFLSEQLSMIIQHPKFKKLESLWLSLFKMVFNNSVNHAVKIKIIDLSWREISDNCAALFDITHSFFYKWMYQEQLDTAGGEPVGMLLVDYQLNLSDKDRGVLVEELSTIEVLAEIGEKCFCPVIIGLDRYIFGEYTEELWFDQAKLNRVISSEDFSFWRKMRLRPSSKFLYFTLPEYKLRDRWIHENVGFVFYECCNRGQGALWGNSIFLVARSVMQTFIKSNWFFFMKESQSFIQDAPVEQCDKYVKAVNKPYEPRVSLFAEHDYYRAECGFVSLSTVYLSDGVSMTALPSFYQHKNREDSLCSTLDVTLMSCRFAHFLKAQIRTKIGESSSEEVERSLNKWLSQYTNSGVSNREDNRYPLRHFSLTLIPSVQYIEQYNLVIQISPYLYSEFINANVILTTNLN